MQFQTKKILWAIYRLFGMRMQHGWNDFIKRSLRGLDPKKVMLMLLLLLLKLALPHQRQSPKAQQALTSTKPAAPATSKAAI
jgi:hypothetical protein